MPYFAMPDGRQIHYRGEPGLTADEHAQLVRVVELAEARLQEETMANATTPITIYADGLCEPNPGGRGCWGWLVLDPSGQIVGEGQACRPPAPANTNNIFEYEAVLAALRWAYQAGYRVATVRSDSQLLVRQVTGAWACQAPGLQPLLARVQVAAGLMQLRWEWVPREQNTAADERSRLAYRTATGHAPPERPGREERLRRTAS